MNLFSSIALRFGGPGSGCNPDVAKPKCGRPGDATKEDSNPEKVAQFVDSFRGVYNKAVGKFKSLVGQMGIVEARLKTPESVMEKMGRKNIGLKDMKDVIGVRVTVPSLGDLTKAVALVKNGMAISDEDNKITNPTNGIYRAYHMTATVDGKPMEIQIRTQNQSRLAMWMHDTVYKGGLAQSGVALQYAKRLSDYMYNVDMGSRIGSIPDCPPALASNCFSESLPYVGPHIL